MKSAVIDSGILESLRRTSSSPGAGSSVRSSLWRLSRYVISSCGESEASAVSTIVTMTCSFSARSSGLRGLRTPFWYTASTCILMAPWYALQERPESPRSAAFALRLAGPAEHSPAARTRRQAGLAEEMHAVVAQEQRVRAAGTAFTPRRFEATQRRVPVELRRTLRLLTDHLHRDFPHWERHHQ